MFVRIGNDIVNSDAIASATWEEAAAQGGHGPAIDAADQIVIRFVGNVPAPVTFRGADARRVRAQLQGLCSSSAAGLEMETK